MQLAQLVYLERLELKGNKEAQVKEAKVVQQEQQAYRVTLAALELLVNKETLELLVNKATQELLVNKEPQVKQDKKDKKDTGSK